MPLIGRSHFGRRLATLGVFTVLLISRADGKVDVSTQAAWKHFTQPQKQSAIEGFEDCYRSLGREKKAFLLTDIASAVHLVDLNMPTDTSLGDTILQALRRSSSVKADAHAEHSKGPTGFHSGLWWRQIEDQERGSYVQGVFWCAQVLGPAAVEKPTIPTAQAVNKLNTWYVIEDEDWKDSRSNARVDVSVVSAMEKTEVLHVKAVSTK